MKKRKGRIIENPSSVTFKRYGENISIGGAKTREEAVRMGFDPQTELRKKPDFTAVNGVNTSVELGGVNIEGDLFPNFFGTSAAAPHAAGVAALLIEAKSKFDSLLLRGGERIH